MYHFRQIQNEDEGIVPVLHPTLAALFIVLKNSANLSQIRRSHPNLHLHKHYNPEAMSPKDISNLLLPTGNRWWESLGKLCSHFSDPFSQSCTAANACQGGMAPCTPPVC